MHLVGTSSVLRHPLLELTDPANAPRKIAVVGLGFVGLPLALSFALRGCQVAGLDIAPQRVSDLNRGHAHDAESYLGYSLQEILDLQLKTGRFRATTEPTLALQSATTIVVTVGIPVQFGRPVMEPLRSACKTVARHLKRGDTVIIRSTVTPGTTERVILPILKESGLKAGEDFHLAYASERIAEGRAFEEFESMPLIMAGINEISAQNALAALSIVTKADIHVSACISAVEAAKVIENVQRDVNIAMVQQLARLFEALDLDTYEVIRLANTHHRVHLLSPGPGVGGFCIPNALYYLLPAAAEVGIDLSLLQMARSINDGTPDVIINLVQHKLSQVNLDLSGARIAVLGLAMKDYSSDDRITPATLIVEKLLGLGATVSAYDPLVPTQYPYTVNSLTECITDADCVLILARQKGAEFSDLVPLLPKLAHPIVIDTKGSIQPTDAVKHGVILGRL